MSNTQRAHIIVMAAGTAITATLMLLCAWLFSPQVAVAATTSPQEGAYQHLHEVMDQFNQTFDVYTDQGAGGNHFVHRAMMQGYGTTNDGYTRTVHSGATSIINTFTGTGIQWGGWSFQNGVLLTGTSQPVSNWGTYPNAGLDLSGATALTFWARGEKGSEKVEFFAFDINSGVYPDSTSKRSTGNVTLGATWKQYTITVGGLNLHYILDGFGWVASAQANNNTPITFYLDDIRYNLVRPNTLRVLNSFVTLTGTTQIDTRQRNVAYTYDNALALIAFASRGEMTRTKLLADAFVFAHQHDRYYTDGRLRNAYQSGDLALPPGWYPNSARLPGYWDAALNSWQENDEEVGTTTGNVAWAMLALLTAHEKQGSSIYLTTTLELGQWVVDHTFDARGAGGFTGGYIGHEPVPTKQMWKSTEHNLDLYAAFERLHKATGDVTWHTYALHALSFINAMNVGDEYYATGTIGDGVTINTEAIPLDAQSWSALVLGDTPLTRAALTTAEISHTATYSGFVGFDFDTDRDMPWPEGTAQMAVAYRVIGAQDKAADTTNHLRAMQSSATNANGKGMVAAPADGLTTGFGWSYFNRLHVGATAWHIFAERRYNPYYNTYFGSVWLPLVRRD